MMQRKDKVIIRDLTTGLIHAEIQLKAGQVFNINADYKPWVVFSSDAKSVSLVIAATSGTNPTVYKFVINILDGSFESLVNNHTYMQYGE